MSFLAFARDISRVAGPWAPLGSLVLGSEGTVGGGLVFTAFFMHLQCTGIRNSFGTVSCFNFSGTVRQ
jgi:hypothetical protein